MGRVLLSAACLAIGCAGMVYLGLNICPEQNHFLLYLASAAVGFGSGLFGFSITLWDV